MEQITVSASPRASRSIMFIMVRGLSGSCYVTGQSYPSGAPERPSMGPFRLIHAGIGPFALPSAHLWGFSPHKLPMSRF